MTMLDKLREEHPEFIGDQFQGGVAICPSDAGYEKETVCIGFKTGELTREACLRCWDREMPKKGQESLHTPVAKLPAGRRAPT